MRRTPIRPRRREPRTREAPRWDATDWANANVILLARAGYACELCGKECGPVERHHRKRRRDGGDRLSNILMLGRPCHQHITEHPSEARRYGWIVSVSRDPAAIPVLVNRREWVTLDDEGGKVPAFAVEDAHA